MLLPVALALGTMFAILRGVPPDPSIEDPNFQVFVFTCIAGISGLLGRWLTHEARRTRQSPIAIAGTGFYCQAILFLLGVWGLSMRPSILGTDAAQRWFTVVSARWVLLCASVSMLALVWRAFRRRLSAISTIQATWVGFAVYLTVALVCAHVFPTQAPIRVSLALTLLFGSLVLFAGTRYFLLRRRPVLTTFMGGILVFLLSQVALAVSPPGHLLWWTGYLYFFSAWMLVGYGVLEAHRAVEREDLILRLGELTSLLEEQSVRDPLTGSFNRRHAMATLESEFKKAQRGRLPLTLLVGDLDNFKQVNDTYGHMAGDQVLRATAQRLAESVRESDVVARCGGEEFWIILPLTNRIGGREVANKTLESMRMEPVAIESARLTVSISIGVADNFSPGVTDVASLIREADRALYAAKHAGKDRVAMIDPLIFAVPTE